MGDVIDMFKTQAHYSRKQSDVKKKIIDETNENTKKRYSINEVKDGSIVERLGRIKDSCINVDKLIKERT